VLSSALFVTIFLRRLTNSSGDIRPERSVETMMTSSLFATIQ